MTTTTATQSSSPSAALFESLNGTKAATSESSIESAQNRFLKLLTTQLKNQDPLNPMDNAQMTSQMAQISTVDGIERLNATLSKLIDGQSESQAYQAAALVGHGVLVPGSQLDLRGGGAFGGVDLAEPADQVTIEIRDANGLLMQTLLLGGQEVGVVNFGWDGTTESGAQAADGSYSFTAKAVRGADKVGAERLNFGVVDGIVRGAQGTSINVGRLGSFGMNDIKQIL